MTIQRSVRGIRQSCPSGYIIGRQSAGDGPAEFIRITDLGLALVNAGSVPVPIRNYDDLGVTVAGPWTASQQFTLAACTANTTFPSTSRSSTAACTVAPTGNVTFYLVANTVGFFAYGPPTGALASIYFAAGALTGTVTWLSPPVSVTKTQVLTLVMPSSADATFAGLTLLFIGDPA